MNNKEIVHMLWYQDNLIFSVDENGNMICFDMDLNKRLKFQTSSYNSRDLLDQYMSQNDIKLSSSVDLLV